MSPARFGTTSTDAARQKMVERQLRGRGIRDERVLTAMAEIPREAFLPADARADAYRDAAVGIAEGQTMSQPWIVACMTELLGLRGDETVLEVGAGSGYAAAVLSRCAARVVTIERHAALAERARTALADAGCHNVEVRVGDGTLGAPDAAPFGGITVTATADPAPPAALFGQLAPGAALVCPVRHEGREMLYRFRDGSAEPIVAVRFVPLVPDPPED